MRNFLLLLLLFGAGCAERSTAPTQAGSTTPAAGPMTTAPGSGKTAKICPEPKADVICTREYKPVVCDGCEYSNACIAGAAGFKPEQCVPKAEVDAKKPCPTPRPDVVCTAQ